MTRQAWRRQDSFGRLVQGGNLLVRSLSQRSLGQQQRTDLDPAPSSGGPTSTAPNLMNFSSVKKNPPTVSPTPFDHSTQPWEYNARDYETYPTTSNDSSYMRTKNPDDTVLLAGLKKAPPAKMNPRLLSTPNVKPPPPTAVLPQPRIVEFEPPNHGAPSYTESKSDDWDYSDMTPPLAPRTLRDGSHHKHRFQEDILMYPVPNHHNAVPCRAGVPEPYRPPTCLPDLSGHPVEYSRTTMPWEYSYQPALPIPTRQAKVPYQPKAWIEISRGVDVPLRGADETWECIRNDFYIPVTCFSCRTELCCIQDADFVVCPVCRVISPVASDSDRVPYAEQERIGGVGLGFTMDDLFRWQMELLTGRR